MYIKVRFLSIAKSLEFLDILALDIVASGGGRNEQKTPRMVIFHNHSFTNKHSATC